MQVFICTHSIDHQQHQPIVSLCSNFYVQTSHLTQFPSPGDISHHGITRAIEVIAGSPTLSEGQFISEIKIQGSYEHYTLCCAF